MRGKFAKMRRIKLCIESDMEFYHDGEDLPLINRTFFYGDGVLNAREDHHEAWQKLAASHPCELVLCSASAERYDLEHPPEPFLLMGLGALMEAGVDSDRVIGFG